MSSHAIRFYYEVGFGVTIELLHTGPCDQEAPSNGECILEDWVENVGDEMVQGELTVPVRVEWLSEDEPVLNLQPNEQRYREALEEIKFRDLSAAECEAVSARALKGDSP